MKTAKDYLDEANAVVKKIDFDAALQKHNSKSAVFIDVRDSGDIAKTGTITDALKIQRGLIEFVADEATKLYNDALKKDSEIILVCGAGGQAALTGKTLIDMGYTNVSNVGAIGDWEKNGRCTDFQNDMSELKSYLKIKSAIRASSANDKIATIVHKGDKDNGSILIKLRRNK